MAKQFKYLFGPVFSRRLGKSLGIDLIPFKTCNLNCVYCECGLTTNLTSECKEYIKVADVIAELEEFLKNNGNVDYVTFSGSGEPTLNSGILEVAKHIKKNHPTFKICLITNSLTLTDEAFFKELVNGGTSDIDLIIPSLDAVSQPVFKKINQPAANYHIDNITEKLIEFSHKFSGKIWLEIFVLPGVNDSDEELNLFKQILPKIKAEKVQLNCLDRPAPYDWVKKATESEMNRFYNELTSAGIECKIVGKVKHDDYVSENVDPITTIIELISRRPGTIEDICGSLNCDKQTAEKYLSEIAQKYELQKEEQSRGTFYRVIK